MAAETAARRAVEAAEVAARLDAETAWNEALIALEEIIAIGRPNLSAVLAEIDAIKHTLPGDPEFKEEMIKYAYDKLRKDD